MRTYKFKGKRKYTKGALKAGEWLYGNYFEIGGRAFILLPRATYHNAGNISGQTLDGEGRDFDEVDPATVRQFTNGFDVNKKAIYEQDIYKCADGFVGQVVFYSCQWRIITKSGESKELYFECMSGKVIGNIHDNPELLEKK